MLTVKGCAQTGLFRRLYYHFFQSRKFRKYKKQVDFRNAGKNREKLFPCWIIVFELFVINSPYYEENTCHWQSMC